MVSSTFYIAAAYIVTVAILGGLLGHIWHRNKTLKDHDDGQ